MMTRKLPGKVIKAYNSHISLFLVLSCEVRLVQRVLQYLTHSTTHMPYRSKMLRSRKPSCLWRKFQSYSPGYWDLIFTSQETRAYNNPKEIRAQIDNLVRNEIFMSFKK